MPSLQKNCTHCATKFAITDEDLKFYDKVSPVIGGKKFPVPAPTLCPDCRQQRRLSFRNERKLYHRKCDLTGKEIISIYSVDKPYKIYHQDEWWSDKWNPLDYGKTYDFSRPFFDQFQDLQRNVPRLALYQKNAENSAYTNHSENLKNCYLTVDTGVGENIYFSKWIIKARDCAESYQLENTELCYESLYSKNCYNSTYIHLSENCRDSEFLYDCKGCSNCFMSSNLRNKQYVIENKQYTKEEYEKIMKNIDLKSYKQFEKYKKQFKEMMQNKAIHKAQALVSCENSSGDFLSQCKNVQDSYNVIKSQDCRFCYDAGHSKDCYDSYEQAFDCEKQYECHACNRGKTIMSCSVCYDIFDSFYSEQCHNSSSLFGCIGLRNKKYCILNKQYTKEEYEVLVSKIIEQMIKSKEWGEFFNYNLSCFGYNETLAHEYFPLTKSAALKLGATWQEEDTLNHFLGPEITLPDNIDNAEENITKEILKCKNCTKNYKIISQEFELYKKIGLPLPRKCADCRYKARMEMCNPRKLWSRKCAKCEAAIQTSYAPERPEKVYCESCYLQEVY